MKSLFAVTAFASVLHSQTYAGANTITNEAAWLPNDLILHVQEHSTDQLKRVALTKPVEMAGASVVLSFDEALVFVDPVGDQAQFRRFGRPDIVVLTRAHPDHLSVDTMIGLLRRDTVVLAPQDVIDQLPLMISNNVIEPFEVGSIQKVDGITFSALPVTSDIPGDAQVYARNRGEFGLVIEVDGHHFYF